MLTDHRWCDTGFDQSTRVDATDRDARRQFRYGKNAETQYGGEFATDAWLLSFAVYRFSTPSR
jgi:hypothetical protein